MKKLLIYMGAVLMSFSCLSQQGIPNNVSLGKSVKRENTEGRSGAYFNLSTGINNNGGIISLGVEIPAGQFSIECGAGDGTWGYKMYACSKYYLHSNLKGWSFGPGIAYSTGIGRVSTNLETIRGTNRSVTQVDPETNLFVAAYRHWRLGRNYNRFYLQLGWCIALTDPDFYQIAGWPVSDNRGKVTKFLAPGAIIVAAGFSFGGKKREQ